MRGTCTSTSAANSKTSNEPFHFGGRVYLYWNILPKLQAIRIPLTRLCSSSALKTLHLIDMHLVPKSLLVAALTSTQLRELRFSYLSFDAEGTLEMPTSPSRSDSLASLEWLELTYLSYPHIFDLVRSVSRLPMSHSKVFPGLRTLRVTPGIQSSWKIIGRYIKSTMPSLEALQFLISGVLCTY